MPPNATNPVRAARCARSNTLDRSPVIRDNRAMMGSRWRAALVGILSVAGAAGWVARPVGQPQMEPQPVLPDAPTGDGGVTEREELEAIALLKDGRRITGFLVENTPQRCVLRIGGLKTSIRADLIERVEVLPPVLDRYRAMRDAIDPHDADQLVMLAEWLRARGRYSEALEEVLRALNAQPGHEEALQLLTLIRSQRELAARRRAEAEEPEADPIEPVAHPPRPARPAFPTLTPEQINLIKVYELDLRDPPEMKLRRETIDALLASYRGHELLPGSDQERESLYRLAPARIADLIFRLRARELYGQIQVIGQPAAFEHFRNDVHRPVILNTCATTRCHGGAAAGRLYLSNERPNSDATVYTNFLILDRFRLSDGTPLINYDDPQSSVLLQMGLPREDSRHPHPPVAGPNGRGDAWRPAYRTAGDRRYAQTLDWIRAMYRPRPEYPVDYQPPSATPAEAALPAGPPR